MIAGVSSFHQVSARLFFGLELVGVDFADEPTVVFVDEKDVAYDVVSRRAAWFPGVAAVEGLQHCAFASDGPTAILIDEEQRVQPRHRSRRWPRPRPSRERGHRNQQKAQN